MLCYIHAQTKLCPYYVFLQSPGFILWWIIQAMQTNHLQCSSTTPPKSISLSTVIISIFLYCWPFTRKLSLSMAVAYQNSGRTYLPISTKYWYHTNDFTTVEERNNSQNSLSCNSFIPVTIMAKDISHSYEVLS